MKFEDQHERLPRRDDPVARAAPEERGRGGEEQLKRGRRRQRAGVRAVGRDIVAARGPDVLRSKTGGAEPGAAGIGCVCFTIYRGISEIYTTVEFPEFRVKSNEIHVEKAIFASRFQTMSDIGLPGLKR